MSELIGRCIYNSNLMSFHIRDSNIIVSIHIIVLLLPFSLLLYIYYFHLLFIYLLLPVQEIIVANLPPLLSGESYQCVFGSVGSGDLTLISGDMYSCEVPDIPQFTQEMEGWSLPYKEYE